MNIRDKSIRLLELDIVLNMLSNEAVSQKAKYMATSLKPLSDIEIIREKLEECSVAKLMMETNASPSFSGIRDITPHLNRANMSGVLNFKELLDIGSLLRATRQVKSYSGIREDSILDKYFNNLNNNKALEDRIQSCILSEDEMSDNASPDLFSIRKKIRNTNLKIKNILGKMTSSSNTSKYLQDNIVTIRSGRYVVPVKSEHRADVNGIVHDMSASGATVFIEPMQVVEANNELKSLIIEQDREIERVLKDLSTEVSVYSEFILNNYNILCELDLIFARASLSYKLNCSSVRVSDDRKIFLKKARHPLLNSKTAVPIDISLGIDYDTLVITGPNTGGKTVSLKTLGLLILMTCCGLHIPVNEESYISIFDNIYVDIGDEQSIEQSLSTFSSHMRNIIEIIKICSKGDLVLLDELGAGTDPVEGAALAVSIVEHLRVVGSKIVATSHYNEMKVFAINNNRVENASCEFDIVSLKPTYRILIGIPGKSNAFAISKKLGLYDDIIDRAKLYIDSDNAKLEDVISKLESDRVSLEQYTKEADALKRMAQSEKDKTIDIKGRAEAEYEKIIDAARLKADNILKEAKDCADEVFNEVLDIRKRSRDKNFKNDNIAAARAEIFGKLNNTNKADKKVRKTENIKVKLGDEVNLINYGVMGTILSEPDSNGNMLVQAGILKVNVNLNEISMKMESPKKPSKSYRSASPECFNELRKSKAQLELDLRGMDSIEAIFELDQFISDALMSKLDIVTIIHGKGTGVLRTAVHQHLRGHSKVKSYRLGKYGEGEQGVTIIEFK